MSSSISEARKRLYDGCVAAAGLVGVQVTFGEPGPTEEREVVAILGVQDPDEDEVELGGNRKRESFTIEVGVKAHDPTCSTHAERVALDARGFVLADAVRGFVHGDRTMSGLLVYSTVTGMPTDGLIPARHPDTGQPFGWVIFIRVLIRCVGDIT